MTADGYVFRVDMRLRPYGDGGPLVSSFEMLENYFITQGREWERYAWIKGRALTGDRGAELEELVRPFVYRRHLDYNAFAALRDLHRQIRLEVERRDIADNIKLGAGRHPRDRVHRAGVPADPRRARAGAARAADARRAAAARGAQSPARRRRCRSSREAYVFLRNLEHRLQYLDDQQTHVLPQSDADRALVAQAMGCADYRALAAALEAHRERVTRHFQDIFAATPDASASARPPVAPMTRTTPRRAAAELAGAGLPPARRRSRERLKAMRASARYREMPAASQARLDRLVPLAIEAAAARARPRRDARARARPARRGEPARLLSRAARGVPAGARSSSPS